jgi:hypothetical protein
LNHQEAGEIVTFLPNYPTFKFPELSKLIRQKIVNTSSLVEIPKGWTYKSQIDGNKFFLIREGSFRYLCDGRDADDLNDNIKDIDLKKILSYKHSSQVSSQEKKMINEKDRIDQK